MSKTMGVMKGGVIQLPEGVTVPDGAPVVVMWGEEHLEWGPPLEREPWTEEEVWKEIERSRSDKWKL